MEWTLNTVAEDAYLKVLDIFQDYYSESPYEAYSVFWEMVCEEILALQPHCKDYYNDFVGLLMNTIKGNNNYCNEYFFMVKHCEPQYEEQKPQLVLSGDLEQCGSYHLHMIKESECGVEQLLEACSLFYKIIVPHTYTAMLAWNEEYDLPQYDLGLETLEQTKKNYNKYRANWRKILTNLETVVKVVRVIKGY